MQKFITKILLATILTSMFTLGTSAQTVPVSSCPSLDMDGDGRMQPYVDGIILNRLLTPSFSEASILNGVTLGSGAVRTTTSAMRSFVDLNKSRYDVDGDGQVLASTDALLILRHQLGISDSGMTSGINTNATPSYINDKINILCSLPALTPVPPVVIPTAPTSCPSLDVNGDGKLQPYVDGIILSRLLDDNFSDSSILNGVNLPSDSSRMSVSTMRTFVDANKSRYDFDGDAAVTSNRDMLYVLRYTLGISGEGFLSGINTSVSVSSIITKINNLCALPAITPLPLPVPAPVCTKELAPVCATPKFSCIDKSQSCAQPAPETYSNKCLMNAAGASYLFDGACESPVVTPPIACPKGNFTDAACVCPNGKSPTPIVMKTYGIQQYTCDAIPTTCTADYAPVCAYPKNNCTSIFQSCVQQAPETYSNVCQMNAAGATFIRNGECEGAVTTVNVIKPNGGEVLTIGSSYDVTNSKIENQPMVAYSLYKSGVNLGFLVGTANIVPDQVFRWVVGKYQSFQGVVSTALAGNDYKISISAPGNTFLDTSDNYFTMSDSNTTTCTSDYAPVCGQIIPACLSLGCKVMTPAPTTYSNRCDMEKAGATYLYSGACDVGTATTTLKASAPNPVTGAVSLTWKSLVSGRISMDVDCTPGTISFKTDRGNNPICEKGGIWSWDNSLGDSIVVIPIGNTTPVTVTFILTLMIQNTPNTWVPADTKRVTVDFPVPNIQNICPKGNFTDQSCVCPNGQSPNIVPSGTRVQQYTCDSVVTPPTKNYCPLNTTFDDSECTCPLGTTMQNVNASSCVSIMLCASRVVHSCVATLGYVSPVETPSQETPTIQSEDTSTATICVQPQFNFGVGSRGDTVMDLQTFLNAKGYLTNNPTGYFGSATRRAVRSFQTENGINSTGFVGQLTRAQLKAKSCEPLIPIPDTPVETSATSMPVTSFVQATAPIVPTSATVVSSINVVAVAPGFSVSSTAVENGNKFTIVFNALNITFDSPHYLKVVYKNSGKSCILTASFVPVAAKIYSLIRSSESVCILGGTIGDLSEIDHIEILRQ